MLQGRVIGQYRLTGILGEGGMGVVYAAEHMLLGRPAAVKVLLPDLSGKQEVVQRFFNEARAATAIRHPGIVEIYDFGWTDEGAAFIVMEHLQGETLRARRKRGPMPWGAALAVTRQIAGALGAAHAKGIVHRDLKPDNIFLVLDPEVPGGERIKLLDFGIAKLAGMASGQHKTRTGAVIGTPTYMAPEQCRGVAIDSRADLYALGCILFELCSGRPPFEGEGEGDVLAAHIYVAAPALGSVASGVPREIEALVQRLLAKAPIDRVQTADEIIRTIDAASTGLSGPRTIHAFPHEPSAAAPAPPPAAFPHEPSAAAPRAAFPHEPSAAAPAPPPAAFPHEPSAASSAPRAAFPHEPSGAAAPAAAAVPAGTIYSETTLSSAVSSHRLAAPRPPRRRAVLFGAAGAVLATIVAIIVIAASGDDDAPATTASVPYSSVAPESPDPEAPPPSPLPDPDPEEQAPPPAPPPPAPSIQTQPPAAPDPSAAPAAPPEQESPPPAPSPSTPADSTPSPVAPAAPPKQESASPARPAVAKRRAEPPENQTPATIDVAIDSSPSGAEVVRDGNVIGKTPFRRALPRTSRNLSLVLRLRGHATKVVTIRPGAASKQHVKLAPLAHDKGVNPF